MIIIRHLSEDTHCRTVTFAVIGLTLNLLYAFYHGILGALTHSVWFGSMLAYYVILSVMRFFAVLIDSKNNIEKEYRVMRCNGILLVFLSIILTGITYISLSQNIANKYGEIVMITIATYTFYKITMAIIKAVKHRKDPSPVLFVIRCISYAEVSVSLFTMQKSMLVSFGEMNSSNVHILNVLTGAGVCFFILSLGIIMIKKGVENNGKIKACKDK